MGRMVILRGIPGSGKTTLAKRLVEHVGHGEVVSADDYFEGPDGYRFDVSRIEQAHGDCFRRAVRTAQDLATRDGLLVVANTAVEPVEVAPYYLMGQAYQLDPLVVTLGTPTEEAVRRNVHGVPSSTIERMADALTTRHLPPWWARVQLDRREKDESLETLPTQVRDAARRIR